MDTLLARVRARRRLGTPAGRRRLRQQAGLAQADLARELGVSRMAISLWERGIRFPRPSLLARYLDLLDRIAKT